MASTFTATYLSNSPPPPKVSVRYGAAPLSTTGSGAPPPVIKQSNGEVRVQSIPTPPIFTDKYKERDYLKGRLALAFRIFAKNDFDEGLAGHITLRDPVQPDHFWANPLGRPFALMRRSDLVLVNPAGEVVVGGPNRLINRPAYMIHHAVHAARPDINCVAHAHSLHGKTFSTLGRNISMLTQDACAFHNDVAVYDKFNGAVVSKEDAEQIAADLGPRKAVVLRNRGLLTCGETVEAAAYWFYALDRCCRSQLMAEAAVPGGPVAIREEVAAATCKSTGTPGVGWYQGQPMFEVVADEAGEDYLR